MRRTSMPYRQHNKSTVYIPRNRHEPQETEITDLAIILDYEHLDLRFTRSVNVSVLFRERKERTPDLESLGGNR